jgi:hypothetical protein
LVILLAGFALGNKVYFGEILIWKLPDFPLLQKPYSILQGTGRFVWPFYYTLLLWIIVSISKISNCYFLIGLLVASLLIQISDVSPLRSASMSSPNQPIIFPENSLKEIENIKNQTNSNYFWILPSSSCPGGLGYSDRTLLFAAVKSHLITNDNNSARTIRGSYGKDCDLIQQLKHIDQLRKDTLYAINKNQASPDLLLNINKPENRNKCKALPKENWILCHREGLSKETITEQSI